MTDKRREYTIGGVTFEVTSAQGRVQKLSVLMGEEAESEVALKLLLKLLDATFVVDPPVFQNIHEEYAIAPRYHDPMKFPDRKRPSPVAELRQFIIEGKHELTDEEFHHFMTSMARDLSRPEKVASALARIEAQEARHAKLQEISEQDQRAGKRELKRLARQLETIKPLLRPVVYALAHHGISLEKDDGLQLAMILGLAGASADAGPSERASDETMIERFTRAVMRAVLSEIGLNALDARQLESDLAIDIGKSWKNRARGQSPGHGAA